MSKKLSILIPVYNEWRTISELLNKLTALKLEKEIIIVDDGSNDGTTEILSSLAHPLIKVVRHPVNRGKGAAIRTGLAHCTGNMVIIQDADLEQDPEDIYQLVQPILKGGAEVVYGSRFLGQRPKMKRMTYWANRFLSALTSFLYGAKITDVETCYKVFKAELIQSLVLEGDGFEFEPEVTAKILRFGIRIHEVPIQEDWYHGYNNNSKKVTWFDGFKAIAVLLKYRFKKLSLQKRLPVAVMPHQVAADITDGA